VTSLQFLWVVAVAQGILLVALIILIILNRWFRLRRSARLQPRRRELEAVMQRWAMGQAPAAEVERALARLPVSLAVDALVTWSARVPGERWQEPVPAVGPPVVGARAAHELPVGALVEAARVCALPLCRGNAARHRPGAAPVAR